MIVDPDALSPCGECVGCGAMMLASLKGGPGRRIMCHPAPLCAHLMRKLDAMGFRYDPEDAFVFSDQQPAVLS